MVTTLALNMLSEKLENVKSNTILIKWENMIIFIVLPLR